MPNVPPPASGDPLTLGQALRAYWNDQASLQWLVEQARPARPGENVADWLWLESLKETYWQEMKELDALRTQSEVPASGDLAALRKQIQRYVDDMRYGTAGTADHGAGQVAALARALVERVERAEWEKANLGTAVRALQAQRDASEQRVARLEADFLDWLLGDGPGRMYGEVLRVCGRLPLEEYQKERRAIYAKYLNAALSEAPTVEEPHNA